MCPPRCCTVSPLPHPGPPLHRQLYPDPHTPLPSTHLQLSPWLPLSADSHPLPLFPTSSSIHPQPPAPISRGQSALCGMDKPGTLSCHPTPPLLGLQSPRTTDLSPRHPHPHVACLYTCASGVGHTWPHDTPGHALLRATQTRPRQTQPRQGAGCSCPRPRPHRESPLPSPPLPLLPPSPRLPPLPPSSHTRLCQSPPCPLHTLFSWEAAALRVGDTRRRGLGRTRPALPAALSEAAEVYFNAIQKIGEQALQSSTSQILGEAPLPLPLGHPPGPAGQPSSPASAPGLPVLSGPRACPSPFSGPREASSSRKPSPEAQALRCHSGACAPPPSPPQDISRAVTAAASQSPRARRETSGLWSPSPA